MDISVVIATLGGGQLPRTIFQLNNGKVVPKEILVCIPKEEASLVEKLAFDNVRVIVVDVRGQVKQRSIGFHQAKYPVVMQMDDDIFLSEDALEILLHNLMILGKGNALAPAYRNVSTGRPIHDLGDGWSGLLKSIFAFLVIGAPWGLSRMGRATKIGVCYGVNFDCCANEPFKTDWLPGGCVLCLKEDLILENFYPFNGKAYSEDVIHSFLRHKREVSHWVIPSAICTIESTNFEFNANTREAQKYVARLMNGSNSRIEIYFLIIRITSYLRNRLKKWINN